MSDTATPGAPATILVVDDEPQNRKLLDALLAPEGYCTVHASDGVAALAAVSQDRPDLILLDVMMPGIDGFEVTRRLKADPATAGIPIVMVTALADRGARIQGLAAGAEEFVTKPVDRTELWLRIRNLLRLKKTQEALVLARDEADRANNAKNEFLSRMSHELRTPLNAVLGFSQIALLSDLNEDQRENLNYISSAGRHLLNLVNDVLDISRIEAGALCLSLEPVRVSELVAYALSLIRPEAAQYEVILPENVDGREHYALADRQCLLQILLNLLSNAVKYNRPGGRVDVICETAGDTVSITVRDTGHGIRDADMSKMFTPFERLGAEATEVAGTGIGLALSRAFSHQMDGTLTARSSLGRGTMLTLQLPASDPSGATRTGSDEPRSFSSGHSDPITVLAIEDNVANLRVLERALALADNVELISTVQGRLGLDLAAKHQPGLILLDLHLPDMPGLEVLRQLRSDPSTASIPIVICSADASLDQRQRLLAVGAAAYLTKPLHLPDLYELVEHTRAVRPPAPPQPDCENAPCST